nr:MAG TPA: hypothetical protein [Caudoviricetes sp.]
MMKIKIRRRKIVEEEIELLPCPFCGSEDAEPVSITGSCSGAPNTHPYMNK